MQCQGIRSIKIGKCNTILNPGDFRITVTISDPRMKAVCCSVDCAVRWLDSNVPLSQEELQQMNRSQETAQRHWDGTTPQIVARAIEE